MTRVEFGRAYSIADRPGVAFIPDHHPGTEDDFDTDWVMGHWLGDDRAQLVEVAELTRIDDKDYCPDCGQIGCVHWSRA